MRAKHSAMTALAATMVCLAGCSASGSPSQATNDAAPSAAASSGPTDAASVADSADDAGAPAAVSPAGAPGAITLHVKAAFTSPYAITDSYDWTFDPTSYAANDDSSPVPATCAELAKLGTESGGQGNPPTFQTPTPPDDGTMSSGQNSLTLQADIDQYAGPRTYSGADVDGTAGMELSNTPELPDDGDGGLLFNDAAQTSSITVNADGSGTTRLVGWQDASGRTASGTLTWTCAG